MHRRHFLQTAAAAALAPLQCLAAPDHDFPLMAADFIGLSYETGQLYNPDFFSPANAPLLAAFRNLNPTGVLRLGGHLSNITPWEGVGQTDPLQQRGVRHGIEDYWEWPLVDPSVQANKRGTLTRTALRNLRGFLDAANWRLLYSLNFASGSSARAADEAAAVSDILGPRLIAFIIGNEPDGFADDPVFRPKTYGFPQYLAEYQAWVRAIRARIPHAAFAGPDTDGYLADWVVPFARATRDSTTLLTSHFYGMGPASDPSMTAQRLLAKSNRALQSQLTQIRLARAGAGGTPYRMDEGNSCFGGGRPGVSDAFASALWAADYILTMASAGIAGVNLHGGGAGIYTPIESSAATPASPRPVYFGMQFAQRFTGTRVSPLPLDTPANLIAYHGHSSGAALLAFINKGDTAIPQLLPAPFHAAATVQRWDLTAPALDSKSGVRFGPAPELHAPTTIALAPYSATLLRIPT